MRAPPMEEMQSPPMGTMTVLTPPMEATTLVAAPVVALVAAPTPQSSSTRPTITTTSIIQVATVVPSLSVVSTILLVSTILWSNVKTHRSCNLRTHMKPGVSRTQPRVGPGRSRTRPHARPVKDSCHMASHMAGKCLQLQRCTWHMVLLGLTVAIRTCLVYGSR